MWYYVGIGVFSWLAMLFVVLGFTRVATRKPNPKREE